MGTDLRTRNHLDPLPHPGIPGAAITDERSDLLGRLADVASGLEDAVDAGDLGAIIDRVHDLRRVVFWLEGQEVTGGG